jgi:hypothetical protein
MDKKHKRLIQFQIFLFMIMLAVLPACSGGSSPGLFSASISPSPSATNTLVAPTETPIPPTETATATVTATLTATATATSTETPLPSPTATETATTTLAPAADVGGGGVYMVKYLVLPDTGGPIGCGDSLIAVSTGQVSTGNVKEDIKLALNSLFSTGVKYVGDLYNPLYQSKLRVSSVELKGPKRDEVIIKMTGKFVKPKDPCDKTRYRWQVWQTVRQFAGIRQANIWLDNGLLLGDLLAND